LIGWSTTATRSSSSIAVARIELAEQLLALGQRGEAKISVAKAAPTAYEILAPTHRARRTQSAPSRRIKMQNKIICLGAREFPRVCCCFALVFGVPHSAIACGVLVRIAVR
jgi:hypothetical protein